MKWWQICLFLVVASACSSVRHGTLFDDLGGLEGITEIADNFIIAIAEDDRVFHRFADSNVERFRDNIIEHFCEIADGPCRYSGDSMVRTHAGMQITDAEFNAVVEDLMVALTLAGIDVATQNRLLSRLAGLKSEITHL